MKKLINMSLLSLSTLTLSAGAYAATPMVYLNKNIGFNVEGYKYEQPALPCDVDTKLVEQLVNKGMRSGLNMETITTKAKVENGIIPVVLIDIEKLELGESHSHGGATKFYLPNIQITAALLKGKDLQTTKHTCATASDTIKDVIILKRPPGAICALVDTCLEDLSKDVIGWVKPQVL